MRKRGKGFRGRKARKVAAVRVPKGARWFELNEDEHYPVYSVSAGHDLWLTRAEVKRVEAARREYEACQKLLIARYDSSPVVKARKAAQRKAQLAERRREWKQALVGVEKQKTD